MQQLEPNHTQELKKALISLFLEKGKHVYKRVKTGSYSTSLLTNATFTVNGVKIHLRTITLSPDDMFKDSRFNLAPHPARVQGSFILFNLAFGFGGFSEPRQCIVPSLLYLDEGEWSLYIPDDVIIECSKYLIPVTEGESFRSKVIKELGLINKEPTDDSILEHIRKLRAENESITSVLLDTISTLEKAKANISTN